MRTHSNKIKATRKRRRLHHRGKMCEKFKNILREYCKNTSLPGFKYIVSDGSSLNEKIMWALVCAVGLTFSVLLMLLIWQRFRITPTVTTIDTTTYPIFGLNFPAISICNYNKVYKPYADTLSEKMRLKGLTEEEIHNFFKSLPRLIRQDHTDIDYTRILQLTTPSGTTIEEIMNDLMQPCENLLLRCAWEGQIVNCSQIFKPIKTPEGNCCAFNYHVTRDDKSIYNVKKKNQPVTSAVKRTLTKEEPGVYEPLTVPGAGRDMGISIVMDLEEDAYFGSIRPSVGASILVHDPFNYPEVGVLTSFIQPAQEIAVILSGSIVASAKNVRTLDLTQRNCWFNDEVKLNISTVYSYQSCVTECRIRYIRRYCRCIPFFYPNYYKARICSLNDINCLTKHRGVLSNLRTQIDVVSDNDTTDSAECNCFPSCNETTYTSNSENAMMANVSFQSPLLIRFEKISLASIYFRSITCLKYRKESWKSWDELIASFGGIFGLCVGGSFVSLVEILYYFANKIFCRSEIIEQSSLENYQPAQQICKVTGTNQLNDWTQKQLNDENLYESNGSYKSNVIYMSELQRPRLKSHSLTENFIRHFSNKTP